MSKHIYNTIKVSRQGHPEIMVIPRRNAVNVTARRRPDGKIRITVPYGIESGKAMAAITDTLTRLIAKPDVNPPSIYHEGMKIECPDTTFQITRQQIKPGHVIARRNGSDINIGVGSDLDISCRSTAISISNVLQKAAHVIAPDVLLPHAKAIADRIGTGPTRWKIGRGHRILGTCHHDGSITLSSLLIFLPNDLRDYIVCHELAHLSEMNHSARFHALCDSYCQGKEKQLSAALKRFCWPILR